MLLNFEKISIELYVSSIQSTNTLQLNKATRRSRAHNAHTHPRHHLQLADKEKTEQHYITVQRLDDAGKR